MKTLAKYHVSNHFIISEKKKKKHLKIYVPGPVTSYRGFREKGPWSGRRDEFRVHMRNLIPVTEMKNALKAPKIPLGSRSDLSAILQAMRSENVSSRKVPVSGLECSYGKNFQLGYRDLGNRASPPSHMNTSKFL